MSVNLDTKATAAALLVVVGLSWLAQAETLALRCEGTKITTERKEPDWLGRVLIKECLLYPQEMG